MTTRPRGILRVIGGIMGDGLPTVIVLALVAGIGWWGHRTGWKLGKFSEMQGHVAVADDWCAEHGVPESICVECDPELLPRAKSHGWCSIHGVPECTLCHPELAQLTKPIQDMTSDRERAKRSLEFVARSRNSRACMQHLRRIQFTDDAAVEKAGIEVEPVWRSPAVEFVAASGEIRYDQTRTAHLSARSPGTVLRVAKHLGETVKAGELLALIDAAEVGKAKAELLQAFALLQLKTQTFASLKASAGAIPEARLRDADAAVRECEIRVGAGCQALTNLGLSLNESELRDLSPEQLKSKLSLLGIPMEIRKDLEPSKTTTNLLPMIAPMDGVIVAQEMVAGEAVDGTRILYEMVDTRHLWLTLDPRGEDVNRLKIGQTVRFRPDGSPDPIIGQLAWISTRADPKTRTIQVRANLPNVEGRYRANTYGTGQIILRDESDVISVPNSAIHWEGCCHVVFIRDQQFLKDGAPKVFHVRKVRIGAKDEMNTEIIAGVLPGELVVTAGSGLLLTELMRAELGEGCACCHPK